MAKRSLHMDDTYRGLVAAIIKQTIEDYQDAKRDEAKASRKASEIYRRIKAEPQLAAKLDREIDGVETERTNAHRQRKEAELFLRGEWFEDLCEFIELDPDYVRRKIKLIREGFHERAGM
jgi:hypothetical protein